MAAGAFVHSEIRRRKRNSNYTIVREFDCGVQPKSKGERDE